MASTVSHQRLDRPLQFMERPDATSSFHWVASSHAGLLMRNLDLAAASDGRGQSRAASRVPTGMMSREKLIKPVANLGEARIGARFVLVAARRPTDADGADRFVADLDGHAT
jgi:hypothetical protein